MSNIRAYDFAARCAAGQLWMRKALLAMNV